jgi:hypothetical protein
VLLEPRSRYPRIIGVSKGVLPRLGEQPAPTGDRSSVGESVFGTQKIAQCVGNVSVKVAEFWVAARKAKMFPRKRAIVRTVNEIPLSSLSSSSVFQTFLS